MGFWKSLKQRYKERQIEDLIIDLAEGLKKTRVIFIEQCILTRLSEPDNSILNSMDQALLAFQLTHALSLIASRNYLENNLEDFIYPVCRHCCNDALDKIKPLIDRYTAHKMQYAQSSSHKQFIAFADDIRQLGSINPIKTFGLDKDIALFYEKTIFYASYTFNDKEIWKPIYEKFKNQN